MTAAALATPIGTILDAIWQPWTEPFMQRALVELALVGASGGALGCWIILYRLSYAAESLAHSIFPGLVAAVLIGIPILAGGVIGLVAAAVLVAAAARSPTIGGDTAIAVVVTSLFGLGALLALSSATPPGIQSLLFGDIFGVSSTELIVSAVLGGSILIALRPLHSQLLVVAFDRGNAGALGGRPLLVEALLLVLLALEILIAVQAMGNLLVVAILIGPAATARLIARRVQPMMVLAAALAVLASIAGLYVSYYADLAGGASVAAVIVAGFVIALVVRRGFV